VIVDHAGGHHWTTGAAILFMGALGLVGAAVIGTLSPDLLGFIGLEAFVSIAILYLGVGGYLVATNWSHANDD